MTEHNNPPAYPSKKRIYRAGYSTTEFEPVNGMTLLDHFAGLAMQGWLASYPEHIEASGAEKSCHMTARLAYVIADAMLEERMKWIK